MDCMSAQMHIKVDRVILGPDVEENIKRSCIIFPDILNAFTKATLIRFHFANEFMKANTLTL